MFNAIGEKGYLTVKNQIIQNSNPIIQVWMKKYEEDKKNIKPK